MWFEVDKDGLADIVQLRGKEFILYELLQNAWDQNVKIVSCNLSMINKKHAYISVEDDDPNGFNDLSHSFTLFSKSSKRSDPEKRGRFNLGEKLVLSICENAQIESTTGTILFDKHGRSKNNKKTVTGSKFSATLKINQEEFEHICNCANKLIVPKNIKTYFNNQLLPQRECICEFEASLPTECYNDQGNYSKTIRKTIVKLYKPYSNEVASIYEMGIPVVETNDKYHVDIMQKVPLNSDRDNVTPSFLKQIRTEILNHTFKLIEESDGNESWVRDASSDKRCNDEAINKVLDCRFGIKRVAYDPSDTEANMKATSLGYTVVHGRSMSKIEWENAKRCKAILPAGEVTPCKPVFGAVAPYLAEDEWTERIKHVVEYTKLLGKQLMNVYVDVRILNGKGFNATYQKLDDNRGIFTYYYKELGIQFFESDNQTQIDSLIIHEFGHQYSSNHLSTEYHKALCSIGAKMVRLAIDEPGFFK